jgi:hypothetical protein
VVSPDPFADLIVADHQVGDVAQRGDHLLVRRVRAVGFEVFARREAGIQAEIVGDRPVREVPAALPANDTRDLGWQLVEHRLPGLDLGMVLVESRLELDKHEVDEHTATPC